MYKLQATEAQMERETTETGDARDGKHVHPSSSAYPEPGCDCSILRREPQTSIFSSHLLYPGECKEEDSFTGITGIINCTALWVHLCTLLKAFYLHFI